MMDGTMLCLISVESNLAEVWIGNFFEKVQQHHCYKFRFMFRGWQKHFFIEFF